MIYNMATEDIYMPFSIQIEAANVKKNNKFRKTSAKKKRTTRRAVIKTVMNNPQTGEWIHRGKKNIVIHKDTAGVVRAMAPFSMHASVGKEYASVINLYAKSLKEEPTRVYSLIAPSQGEFYMPEGISDNLKQAPVIRKFSDYLDPSVTPIFVCDSLMNHTGEEIYNRTDHHWSPLGAYYAANVVANRLGSRFTPISEYTPDTVRNYVGTMYKLSGDSEILKYPEDFIYYITPGDYYAEFIDYTVKNQTTVGESACHIAPIFRKFHDGSSAAYSTYLGGDNHTVNIVNKNGNTGRRVLIVKDSFGNALAPFLINSFDRIYVVDFRYFPHNLLTYIRKNKITDLIFLNSIELAFAPKTSERLRYLLTCK